MIRPALAALVCAAAIGSGSGTFASFSASTTNAATFDTGTVVLSNELTDAETCFSTGGGTTDANDGTCDALFPVELRKPGATASSTLTLRNEGTLASTLHAAAPACATSDNDDEDFHGDGDLCTSVLVQVQEFANDAFGALGALPVCAWPVVADASCGWSFGSLADLVTQTATTPIEPVEPLLGPGDERYMKVTLWWIDLGAGHDHNPFMGRQADFSIRWGLEQTI